MPKYRFAVRTREGKLRTGTVTEATLEGAKSRLTGAGFVIVTLQEEAELVVLESRAPSGVKAPKPERAAIIEFETTLGERISDFLSRFVLRKEFALALLVIGGAWALYQNIHRTPIAGPPEPTYLPLTVEIEIDPGGLSGKGTTYEVILPDIPLRFSQPVSDGPLIKYSFEAVKQPGRVLANLLDQDGQPVGEGEGLLSLRGEGQLSSAVPLTPVKTKAP
jgi:hypothetical protein